MPQTAPDGTVAQGFVTVTHPFHPFYGQSLPLLHWSGVGGERRVAVAAAGRIFHIPERWTDAAAVDLFVMQSAGRALFRPVDLLALVELVQALGRGVV